MSTIIAAGLFSELQPIRRLGAAGLGAAEGYEALIRGWGGRRYPHLIGLGPADERAERERAFMQTHLTTVASWVTAGAPFTTFYLNLAPALIGDAAIADAIEQRSFFIGIEVTEAFEVGDAERYLRWHSDFAGPGPVTVLDDVDRQRGAVVAMLAPVAARVKIDLHKTRELEERRVYDRDVWARELDRMRARFPRAALVVEGVETAALVEHLRRRVCAPTGATLLLQGHAITAAAAHLEATDTPNGYRFTAPRT